METKGKHKGKMVYATFFFAMSKVSTVEED